MLKAISKLAFIFEDREKCSKGALKLEVSEMTKMS